MAFDATKPNTSQVMGDVIDSARANDVDLDARIEAHKADPNGHGLAAVRANVTDYLSHKTDQNAHGVDVVRAQGLATQAEVSAARGIKSSLTARLDIALGADGALKLSTLNNKWITNNDIPTYISTTSFSVPGDRTGFYVAGAQLRFHTAGDYLYAPVASRVFSAGVTTVTLDPAYAVLTAGIQSVDMGLIAWDNTVAAAVSTLNTALTALTATVNALQVEQIEDWIAGKPGAGALVKRFIAARPFSIPQDAVGSQCKAGTASTGAVTFNLAKNGVNFGTIAFAVGGTVATFSIANATAFAAGDVLSISAPAVQDTTLADIAFFIKGLLT